MQRAPAWATGVGAWAVGALLLTVAAALSGGAAFAAPAKEPAWASYTQGLEVHGVVHLRIHEKNPDVWFASVWGNATGDGKDGKRGFCQSTDKGKKWVALRQGFEEPIPERAHFEIALDPKDPKTIYVVVGGKIYKSVNGGQSFEGAFNGTITWSFDQQQSGYWIAGVVVDPSNSKNLYAGTLTNGFLGGLFKSVNAGQTWTQIAGMVQGGKDIGNLGHDAWPLTIDAKSDKFILAGGRRVSALASEKYGTEWKHVQPGAPGHHTAYQFTPMVGKEALLAASNGLWRTRDAGETWGRNPVLPGKVIAVAQDPTNRKQVYAIVEGAGLYHSENLTKWEGPKHAEVDATDVYCHPTQKDTVFLMSETTGLWISTDAGANFTQALGDEKERDKHGIPPAVPAIVAAGVHPADPNQALAITDRGAVFASKDRGVTWARSALLLVPVTRLVADPSAPGAWLAAGPGVWRTTDGGATWQRTLQAADPEDRVIALEPGPDGTLYALWERDPRILWSKDGGQTWDKAPIEIKDAPKEAWGAALAVNARDPKHMLVALKTPAERPPPDDKNGGPYETKDGGKTWTLLSPGFKTDKQPGKEGWTKGAAAGIDPVSGVLYYAVDGVGFFRWDPTLADKAAWEEVAIPAAPSQPTFSAFHVHLAVVGGVPRGEVYAQWQGGLNHAILRSVDSGRTWTQVADAGAVVSSLSVDPSIEGRLFAGDVSGDRGVLVFEPTGAAPAVIPPTPPSPPPGPPPGPPVQPGPTPPGPKPAPTEVPVDGLVAYSGGDDGMVKAWDLHKGTANPNPLKHDKAVLCAALSKDETRLYTVGTDRLVHVWDGQTGQVIGAWPGHYGPITALALSSDGTRLYTGDVEWKIYVWDTVTGKKVASYEEHTDTLTALALSADGKTLYSASRDPSMLIRVWDTAQGKPKGTITSPFAEIAALALSPDGRRLYVAGKEKAVHVLDANVGNEVAAWPVKHAVVQSLALSPDGATLYVAGDGKDVEAFTTADGKPATTLSGADKGHASVAVSADGKWVVAGGGDGMVRLWKAGVAAAQWTSPEGHKGAVKTVVLTWDVEKPGGTPPAPPGPTPPAMGEAPPAMAEPPPAMGESPPAMGEAPPPPAMGEPPPAMGG